MTFKATATYSLISNNGYNGYCVHVDGEQLSSCFRSSVSLIGYVRAESVSCESHCTNQSSCVGYAVRHFSVGNWCYLYSSDTVCPAGFDYNPGKTAEKMDDLKCVGGPGQWPEMNDWACYGKNLGKRIVQVKRN